MQHFYKYLVLYFKSLNLLSSRNLADLAAVPSHSLTLSDKCNRHLYISFFIKKYLSRSTVNLRDEQVMYLVDKVVMSYNNEDFLQSQYFPLGSVQKIQSILQQVSELNNEKLELEDIQKNDSDSELKKIATEDIKNISCQLSTLKEKVADYLLESQSASNIDEVFIEVSAGVGGQEAMLFAQDLLNMYKGFCLRNGWSCDLIEIEETSLGGIRNACLAIKGLQCYSKLKYEGGIHRVQRVPSTEKGGRIHTSTASVSVLPQPSEIMVDIKKKDIKVDTMRASGPGGQHVNKTDTAVRITHLPSGIVVENKKERSQEQNKKLAMQRLRSKLYEKEVEEQQAKSLTQKRLQVGTKARSEKIRTYNFPHDRATDHRLGVTVYNLVELLKGGLPMEKLVQELVVVGRKERLLEIFELGKKQ